MFWTQVSCLTFMLIGVALVTSSYMSPYWDKLDPDDVNAEVDYRGFWASCSGETVKSMKCAPFVKLVGVANIVMTGRVLGGLSIFTGLLTCIVTGYIIHQNRKGKVTSRNGLHPGIIMMLITGLASGGSILFLGCKYAYDIVTKYHFDTNHMALGGSSVARHTLGSAFFMAWFGGALMVLATLAFPCVQGSKKKKPVTTQKKKGDNNSSSNDDGLEFCEKYNALPHAAGGVYV